MSLTLLKIKIKIKIRTRPKTAPEWFVFLAEHRFVSIFISNRNLNGNSSRLRKVETPSTVAQKSK